NPVAACRDGAYIGVGTQAALVNPVNVTGLLLPGEEILFSQAFSLTTPADNSVYPFLVLADYFYVSYDPAYAPLDPGDVINMGSEFNEVLAVVGDCYIDSNETEVGAGFTYQGRLDDSGQAADGTYDLQFRVFDARLTGNQIGKALNIGDVEVSDGLFTVELDFGAAVFTGSERWLEIAVRGGNSTGSYTTLAPRQEITAVPYALGLRGGAVISGTTLPGEGLLTIKNNIGEGLMIDRAHNGVVISSSVSAGVWVESTDNYGLYVNEAGREGVVVWDAEDSGVYVNQAGDSGVSVGQSEGHGVSVGLTGFDGFYASSVADDGFHVENADNDGLYIGHVGNPGTYNTANNQNDGIEISDVEDDGIYIRSAGYDGIDVQSANVGIRANGTSWAGVFHNDVYMFGNCVNCNIAVFGRNNSQQPLTVGDLVTVNGLADRGQIAGDQPVMDVQQAALGHSVLGVVVSAAELVPREDEAVELLDLVPSTETTAAPGEYVTIMVYGVAQIKVSQASQLLTAGDRVTLGAPHEVRALQTTEVNGIQLAEDAPTIGTALEDFDGNADGLIWVLINPR
ncbi:MAG: hypothetical protein KDE51_20810, partial [Anaerolineales bacterium]|nr:hypothetical protein [Anaerolineales bacterium]